MKLFIVVLLSLLSYHCCTGYPVVDSKLSEDFLLENGTSIETEFDTANETASNTSSPLDMHGIDKKGDEKLKGSIKTAKDKAKGIYDKVKDKAKDIYDKVKDKVKDKYDKVKDKIKDFKDKIGNKGGGSGGGSGGGYYRDKYDRDYDRDRYNRDYDRDRYNRDYDRDRYGRDGTSSGGSGPIDPTTQWIGVGIGIFIAVGGVIFVIVMKLREIMQRDSS